MSVRFQEIRLSMTAGSEKQFPKDGLPQIALSGRSNVGKSSLLNCLSGRKSLARVSSAPGKTITVNFYQIDNALYLVDLPGYGFARRPLEDKERWSGLTNAYFTSKTMQAVAQLIDLKVGPTADDRMMIDFLNRKAIPYMIVATKTDKLNQTERAKAIEALKKDPMIHIHAPIVAVSSLTGEGKEDCIRAMLSLLGM